MNGRAAYNIELAPTPELIHDLLNLRADAVFCRTALKLGLDEYDGRCITHRLEDDYQLIERIEGILNARQVSQENGVYIWKKEGVDIDG